MCGEHKAGSSDITATLGSSPHVRGAPGLPGQGGLIWGIIPACAGSTITRVTLEDAIQDHPRMCGEHSRSKKNRVGGAGSSPHVRGAPRHFAVQPYVTGIIPACAGSTTACCWPSPPQRDHPRMCGEHFVCLNEALSTVGSSPHVRGARPSPYILGKAKQIIPACAGSTYDIIRLFDIPRDHPRMCGEHDFCRETAIVS